MLKPHGGKLVNRIISHKMKEYILSEIKNFSTIIADDEVLSDIKNIATGVFSPLKGFMTKEELHSVAYEMQLPEGYVWTIPILLQFQEKPAFTKGDFILLKDKTGKPTAILEVKEVYRIELEKIAKLVWGTENSEHPGVRYFYSKGQWAVGGDIWLIARVNDPFKDWILDPGDIRQIFKYKKWRKIVGFQTRNPPHKAHEYLQRLGLEMADGLFINPVIGWKKSDDFNDITVLKAYNYLITNYYPKNRVILSGLTTSMRYAGPKEAVFHAIIRKNFGCTHFIVGRDHAGVGNFYDPYEAHRIFEKLPSDIEIEIIRASSVFYCSLCGTIASDKTCGHGKENRMYVSMTKIREIISEGRLPSSSIIRPDIARIIAECFVQ